jgi:hypothetical protein
MTYPVFDTSHIPDAYDLHGGPVTCSACGCRLQRAEGGREAWFHFAPLGGRDARGCRVVCADAAHDAHGRALTTA